MRGGDTMSEKDYTAGQKQAIMAILQQCCAILGYDDIDARKRAWILEREGALVALRVRCFPRPRPHSRRTS